MSDLIARLIAAGTPPELLAEVAMELGRAQGGRDALAVMVGNTPVADAAAEKRRAYDRERKRLAKENNSTGNSTEAGGIPVEYPLNKETPPTPPKEINPPSGDKSPSGKPRARKADDFELPERIPAEPWEQFVAMRKRIGKPMTAHAMTLAVNKLDELADAGWPPGDVLNNSTLNSYQGLFPPKDHRNGQRNHGSNRSDDRAEYRDPVLGSFAYGNGP